MKGEIVGFVNYEIDVNFKIYQALEVMVAAANPLDGLLALSLRQSPTSPRHAAISSLRCVQQLGLKISF